MSRIARRRRMVALTALMLAGVASAVASANAHERVARTPVAGSWSAPTTLAATTGYAVSPVLAVSESGRAVAAWLAGPPPSFNAATGAPTGAGTQSVVVALGTAAGGFGTPFALAGGPSGTLGRILVAVSGSGVVYVAWQDEPASTWMIATARAGTFTASQALTLPPGAQLLTLASARAGAVDAFWYRVGVPGAPALDYAPLLPTGSLGRTIPVAHLGSPVSEIEFALNDHGAAIASWVVGDQGVNPSHPRAAAHVRAVLCSARGRCGTPQTLSLGPPQPRFVHTATTLSDDGTAAVFAGGERETLLGAGAIPFEIGPNGLWAAVSRNGGRFRSTPELSATGDFPVATAIGGGGAIAFFNVGLPPTPIAFSTLAPKGAALSSVRDLPDQETVGAPVLAANLAGSFVTAWVDNSPASGGLNSLRATTGNASGAAQPTTIVPAQVSNQPADVAAGIDGHGNAIVLWNEYGSGGLYGLFAAFERP